MPDIQFPQLHDLEFVAQTLHVPAAQLAEQLGCDALTVEKYRHIHGLLQRPRWSEVDIELLTHFYGQFAVAYIAEGLRRSQQSVYTYAYRHGLKADRTLRTSNEARARFWTAWQGYIECNWGRWVRAGVAEGALELLWRPATPFPSCRDCPHLSHCRATRGQPVPCERLTLREALNTLQAASHWPAALEVIAEG